MKAYVAHLTRHSAVSLLALSLVLPGCAPGGGMGSLGSGVDSFTQAGRLGPNDGSDSCYAEAQVLDNTGNFFTQDILTGAAVGAVGGGLIGGLASGSWKGALIGAAVGAVAGGAGGYWEALQKQDANNGAQEEQTVEGNLTTENNQISASQEAFNNDMDCRFQQAQTIRDQYASGALTHDQAVAQMANVKQWAARDVQLAQEIDNNIASRGAQFDTAVSNLSDGQQAPGALPQTTIAQPAAIRRTTPLYLRPDDSAPVVTTVARRDAVTVTGERDGYALVQTSDGTRGFAPAAAIGKPGSLRPAHIQTASLSTGGTPVQQLDGSNAASRDSFAQSVSVSQSAVSNGFQLAG
jgi:hypothetical protein